MDNNTNFLVIFSFVRVTIPGQGRSRLLKFPAVGIHGFCDHVCVQSLPVHRDKALHPHRNSLFWNDRLWYDRVVQKNHWINSRIKTRFRAGYKQRN